MSAWGMINLVVLPAGLGLLGFVEPCSIGATLVFIKYLEGKRASEKRLEVAVFAVTRAVVIGLAGILASLVGTAFLGMQKAAWIGLGMVYVMIGALYVGNRMQTLMVSLGPGLEALGNRRGPAVLGALFGLNIPACAAPLLGVLLTAAATRGAAAGTLAAGFISLALFGLALSLPLVLAVLLPTAARALDRCAALSRRMPLWTGLLLIALGLWSIGFALFAEVTL
jgi:cytochrome c-type biogenesis protein